MLLSVGFHGLLVTVLGMMPLVVDAVPEFPKEIQVELVGPEPSAPPVAPAMQSNEPPSPQVAKAVVPTHRPGRVSKARATHHRRHAVARTISTRSTVMPQRPVVRRSEPVRESLSQVPGPIEASTPAFLEVPRSLETARFVSGLNGKSAPPADELVTSIAGSYPDIRIVRPIQRTVSAIPNAGRVFRDPSAETADAPRTRVRAGDNLRPEYPRAAREAGWEGTVMVRVEVLPDGKAGAVTLHRSSGYAILDDAAITAVQRWRFYPAMDGNFPIRSTVQIPIRFDLKDTN
jgi:protein TonB